DEMDCSAGDSRRDRSLHGLVAEGIQARSFVEQVPGRVNVENRRAVRHLSQHPEDQSGGQQGGGRPVRAQDGGSHGPQARLLARPSWPVRAGFAYLAAGIGAAHNFTGVIWPPLECHKASHNVTSVIHRVIRLRGTWISATHAIAVYHAKTHGAPTIQAKVRANGATTSRGWSEEIRR